MGRECRKARQEEMVRIYGYWWFMIATEGRTMYVWDCEKNQIVRVHGGASFINLIKYEGSLIFSIY